MIEPRTNHSRLIGFFIVTIFIATLLISIPRVSTPLAIAFIFSMILRPCIPLFNKFGITRNLSIFLLFLGIGLFLIYPIIKFAPAIQEEIEKFQFYIPKIEQLAQNQYNMLQKGLNSKLGIDLPSAHIGDFIPHYSNDALKSFILSVPNFLVLFLEQLLLVPLFLFFMLRDGSSIKHKLLKLVPNAIFERTYYLISQFSKKLGDYIFAKFVEAVIIGTIITLGLLFMEVRFAFTLGITAAITNIIPYLGPILGIVPGIIIAAIDYGTGSSFWAVLILYTLANIFDLAFVFPILVSKIVNLHPVSVVVSVIVGSQYFGVMGMVVSIPLAASLKLVLNEFYPNLGPP